MADDDLFDGMDAPRPLSDSLRARLEEQLLDTSARPLDADLDARLAAQLNDPAAVALEGLDAPRVLSPAVRSQLESALVRRRRTPWFAGAAAAVVAVAVGSAALLSGGSSHPTRQLAGGGPSSTPTFSQPSNQGDFAAGGTTGGSTSGSTGGGLASAPQQSVPGPKGASAYDSLKSFSGLRVSPGTGTSGDTVRLTGFDLRTVTGVLFGDRQGTDLAVEADGSVTVRVPAGQPGSTVDVRALLSDGRSVVAVRGFTYRAV